MKFDIKKRNEEFQKMTPEQKRVAVAKDVLAYLDAKVLTASAGKYLKIPRGAKRLIGVDLHTLLGQRKCEVCAIGSVFASLIGWTDDFKIAKAYYKDYFPRDKPIIIEDTDGMLDRLVAVFDETQLRLMEMYFEGCDIAGQFSVLDENNAIDWHDGFGEDGDDRRLRAIMENLIANNGTFEPAAQTSAQDSATPKDAPTTA